MTVVNIDRCSKQHNSSLAHTKTDLVYISYFGVYFSTKINFLWENTGKQYIIHITNDFELTFESNYSIFVQNGIHYFLNGISGKHWNLYKLNIWLWIHKKKTIFKFGSKQNNKLKLIQIFLNEYSWMIFSNLS